MIKQLKEFLALQINFPFLTFIEWVEFTPYEIGMAKYGTFVKTEQFGNKFFCGKLVRSYKEPPIHYLEGKILNATPPLITGFKPWGAVSRKPRKLFGPVKPLENLEPCEYRAVLVAYSKDEWRFPSYKKFQAYTLLRF